MEHTKGKWEVRDFGIGTITFIDCGNIHMAQLAYCDYSDKSEEQKQHELQLTNARRICQCVNGFDALLKALIDAELAYSVAINRTPTSGYREKLTNMNIERLQAIAQAEDKE